MSAWELTETPAKPVDASPEERPRLRSIPGLKRSSIRGLPFAALVVTVLAAGMIGLLALNVHIQNEQLALNKAQKTAAALALQVSDRQAQVYAQSAPGALASAAGALGMVPNANPAYVDLRTGKILGVPTAASGNDLPALRVNASASPSPTPASAAPSPSAFPSAGAKPAPTASASPQPTGATASAKATVPVKKP